MKLFELFLTEAPIGDIHTHGDFSKPGSLRQDDLSLATPKRQDKIKRVLQKAPVLIDLHFVNQPHHIDIRQHLVSNPLGFISVENLQSRYDINITPRRDAVNIVMMQNEGDDRVPLTPWIIAHRIAHIFEYSNHFELRDLLDEFFKTLENTADAYPDQSKRFHRVPYTEIARTFGTTRACREGLIKPNRVIEWLFDSFAQMCVTGTIRFNPAPPDITDEKGNTYRTTKQSEIDQLFNAFRDRLINGFTMILRDAVGKIMVF